MFKRRVPFANLTDRQWDALRPHLAYAGPQGRPVADLRRRMDGIFHLIATDALWREVPSQYGQAGTVARHFRRLTQAGLWDRLHDLGPWHPLQQPHRLIFRASRRAYRIRRPGIIVRVRSPGSLGVLPGLSWMAADPDLSKSLVAPQWCRFKNDGGRNFGRFVLTWGKALRNLMGMAGGRPNMPRSVRLDMP